MVLAAAGLAHEGWRPLTYSIASFATARCFEQIKISVAYPHLPVILVGAGGGFAYGSSGVTHHSAEDLALLGSLPRHDRGRAWRRRRSSSVASANVAVTRPGVSSRGGEGESRQSRLQNRPFLAKPASYGTARISPFSPLAISLLSL